MISSHYDGNSSIFSCNLFYRLLCLFLQIFIYKKTAMLTYQFDKRVVFFFTVYHLYPFSFGFYRYLLSVTFLRAHCPSYSCLTVFRYSSLIFHLFLRLIYVSHFINFSLNFDISGIPGCVVFKYDSVDRNRFFTSF